MVKREIKLPEGVSGSMEGPVLTMAGKMGKSKRSFDSPFTKISLDGDVIVLESGPSRREKRVFETFAAHVGNMIKGVTLGFRYELQVAQSHFPIKVAVKGDRISVENFLGEKTPRLVHICPGVKARVDGKSIFVEGSDIEDVSHTAQALENITRIRAKDRRVFQDGIYIVSRGTVE